MEFRLLGPLEVVDDRGTVALCAAKPRAVLAVLLLHANQPVSAERLAAALWGDEVQPDAVRTVRVYVRSNDGRVLNVRARDGYFEKTHEDRQ